jgi:hypothetical protein
MNIVSYVGGGKSAMNTKYGSMNSVDSYGDVNHQNKVPNLLELRSKAPHTISLQKHEGPNNFCLQTTLPQEAEP